MKRWAAALGGMVLAAAAATTSLAQTPGDPEAGLRLAQQVCAACHRVTADQPSPPSKAPDFAAIAAMSSTTETALHVFLSTPHGNMPNLILKPQQQDDVIAYILGLRGRNPGP